MLSAGAPTARVLAHAELADWMRDNSRRLYMCTVSLAELTGGVSKLWREGATRKAAALETWIDGMLKVYEARILPLDVAAAKVTGGITDRARALGRPTGFADLAIAGIALANDLTVLTRNLRHFAPLGVPAHDPYDSLPG